MKAGPARVRSLDLGRAAVRAAAPDPLAPLPAAPPSRRNAVGSDAPTSDPARRAGDPPSAAVGAAAIRRPAAFAARSLCRRTGAACSMRSMPGNWASAQAGIAALPRERPHARRKGRTLHRQGFAGRRSCFASGADRRGSRASRGRPARAMAVEARRDHAAADRSRKAHLQHRLGADPLQGACRSRASPMPTSCARCSTR